MTFPLPLLALLMAQRQGDSASDAGRIALMSLMIKPPMVGLMLAVVMAKQAAPKPPALPAPNPTGGSGTTVIDTVVPKQSHTLSFFPTFLGLTKKQASSLARELALDPTFVEIEQNTPGKDTVKGQDPLPGAEWHHGRNDVKLYVA